MARADPNAEAFTDLAFPINGVDQSKGYAQQSLPIRQEADMLTGGAVAPNVTLPAVKTTRIAQNVRTFEPSTDRARGGSRPGLKRLPIAQVPNGAHLIQHLALVVDPSADALLGLIFDGPPTAGLFDFIPDPSTNPIGTDPLDPLDFNVRNRDGDAEVIPIGGTGAQRLKTSRRTPKIIWANPADITVGTALDSTQLNAVALDPITGDPVDGTFTYTPPSGTVLSVGDAQILFVVFVPELFMTYNGATKRVRINVKTAAIQARSQEDSTASSSSRSLAFNSDVHIGALLVVAVALNSNDELSGAPTDSQGNTYTQVGTTVGNFFDGVEFTRYLVLYKAVAGSSGPCTVSYQPAADALTSVCIVEYPGYTSTTEGISTKKLDEDVDPPSSAFDTGSVTVLGTGRLLLGAFWMNGTGDAGDQFAAGAGFVMRTQTNGTQAMPLCIVDNIHASTSAAVTASSVTGDTFDSAIGASFKPA